MSRAVLFFLGILLLPRAAELLAPFLLGLILYFLCRGSVRRMTALGLSRAAAAFFSLAFAAVIVLALAAMLGAALYSEGIRLPELYARLSAGGGQNSLLRKFISAFGEELSQALRTLAIAAISRLSNAAEVIMTLIFALLSAFFFLKDEDELCSMIEKRCGEGFLSKAIRLKGAVTAALGGYVRAQLILMALTFILLSVFLLLFGVKYSLLWALGIAFLDAIPIFGTGFVLLPWAFYKFLIGETSLGFGLLALYGVCSLTRQILEPKLVSSRIGLHPLLTLAGIFAGFKLFGVLGLIFGPMLMLIFVTYIQNRA